jgi:hypothetical protein
MYYLTIICNEIHHQSIMRYISDYNKENIINFTLQKFIYSGIIEFTNSSCLSDYDVYHAISILIPDLLSFLNQTYYGGCVFLEHHIRKDLVFDILDR